MQALRDYQARAVAEVRAEWAGGKRRVLLVLPTGGGKSLCGQTLVEPFRCALWIAPRVELIRDASERMAAAFGPLEVGVIAPGFSPSPYSRVQVTTIQTLLARGIWPDADLVVFDEAAHYAADQWSAVGEHYSEAKHLLLTATPERSDGKAMGGIADVLVMGASYSELLAAGHLVPIKAYRPEQILGSNLAQDPVDAWVRYSDGGCGFAFHPTVAIAHEVTARMKARGIRAEAVEQSTPRGVRQGYIDAMRSGELDCLNNVYVFTEGTDIPRARVCMLASAAHHCGNYLQKAGRVLRPHPSKQTAILIDLVGASILHGLPTEDRRYSLDGKPIERTEAVPLRPCLACGAVVHAAYTACPECGNVFAVAKRKGPRIYSMELVEVFAGKDTPDDTKRKEYQRLRALQKAKGWDLYWVQREMKKLFEEDCVLSDATTDEKREQLAKLQAIQRSKGLKPGFVFVRFKMLFGHPPPR